jgi:hypothetical protein
VAAIASTSQLSPNPSRRVCTGVVSSGPWTWFGKSSCCALCVQLCVHQYQLAKSIILFFFFFDSSLFQDLIAAGENIQEASLRLQISMNCFPVSKTLPTSYRCALKRPNSRSWCPKFLEAFWRLLDFSWGDWNVERLTLKVEIFWWES